MTRRAAFLEYRTPVGGGGRQLQRRLRLREHGFAIPSRRGEEFLRARLELRVLRFAKLIALARRERVDRNGVRFHRVEQQAGKLRPRSEAFEQHLTHAWRVGIPAVSSEQRCQQGDSRGLNQRPRRRALIFLAMSGIQQADQQRARFRRPGG